MMIQQKLIVFLPAHNEEKSISQVITRIPRYFDPRIDVKVLVIDDGSQDDTVNISRKAGADYIYSFPKNKGLGAAVRKGLEESLKLGADVVVYIDADNEYPAEEIPDLLEPIFQGKADYIIGSRFLGNIRGMKFHRRLGNYFFTLLQSLLLRTWIYDGQSGMRAFTKQAAEHAEIIHDYNYAQVLTINLLRKGFKMKEIPINYQVRAKGDSYIKFKAYLTNVIPAIYKEMKRPVNEVQINKESNVLKEINQEVI